MENKKAIRPFGLRDKFAYMLGDVGCNMVLSLANGFLLIFYTKVMGVAAAVVSTLFMLARFVDAFTDVAMGRIVDTHTDKNGDRFRPWIAYGSVPLVLFSCLMFNHFLANAAMSVKIVWLIVTYLLFGSVCYTAVNIPYGAMSNVISCDPGHRASLSTWRSVGSQVGALILGMVIPMVVYVKDADGNSVASGPRFFVTAIGLGLLALICLLICWKGSVERIHLENKKAEEKSGNSVQLVLSLFKDKALLLKFAAGIFVYAASQVFMAFNQYMFLDYFGNTALSGIASLVLFAGMMAAAPFATALSKKFGKKELSTVGMGLSTVAYIVMLITRVSNPLVYFVGVFVAFFGLGLVSMVGFAMTNDCIDDYYLRTGKQVAGTVYAVDSFVRKLAGAVSTGIGGWGLALIGYNEIAAVQTESVRQSLFTLSTGLTAVCFGLAFILMFFFPMNKKRVEEIAARMAEDQNSKQA